MTDFDRPCETETDAVLGSVFIPGCWGGVIHGEEGCICPGSPNALQMDRTWAAWLRLGRMRAAALERQGLRVLPSAGDQHVATPMAWGGLRVVKSSSGDPERVA